MVSDINYQQLFFSTPNPYLILDTHLNIIEVNNAYLKVTMVKREDIMGKNIFVVFPDNPNDPLATGSANLTASLNRVLNNKKPDTMAVQKYDIQRTPEEGGGFEERFWCPVNIPVIINNKIEYIIHHAEDVTEFIRLKLSVEQNEENNNQQLRSNIEKNEVEIYKRAQEIQKANERLHFAYQELEEKQKVIHELSTPILQVRDKILLLPIIGLIDQHRMKQITESLLATIHSKHARVAILDLTGVPIIDQSITNAFMKTINATKLMGVKIIVTGISQNVGEIFIEAGLNFLNIVTKSSLQDGLEEAYVFYDKIIT
jgi:anti-anti-sigma regulatory factor